MEIIGLFLFMVVKSMSNIGGIGGGGITLPIIMIFFGFETKQAIALSSFSILLSTTSSFIVNWKEKHPEKPFVHVIDYGLVSVMLPTTLAGSQIGAFFLVTFPDVFIHISLTVILAIISIQSFCLAKKITQAEKVAFAKE
jgi:uncharacterized membrane protein YfcA